MADSAPETDSRAAQQPAEAPQPPMTMHPITYSGMPMHMYPFAPGMVAPQPQRTKRRQVKNACTNCQKACKKCDDARPCLRCVKYGISEECIDSQRKERQKGIKRGPYKKRDGKDRAASGSDNGSDAPLPTAIPLPAAIAAAAAAAQPMGPYMPMGYPASFFGPQYATGPGGKPGEAPTFYPVLIPYPVAQPPPGQEGEAQAFPPPGLFPTFLTPYGQGYPPSGIPYMLPHMQPRADGQQMVMPQPLQYAPYPQMYPKPQAPPPQPSQAPSQRETSHDMGHQMMDPNVRRDPRMEAYNGRMVESMTNGHGK